MGDGFKAKRVATLQARIPDGEGNYERVNFGAVLTTKFPGNYRIILELDTGEKDEDTGYAIRDRITAVKTDAMKKGLDISEAFIHLNAWDTMEKRPPRED